MIKELSQIKISEDILEFRKVKECCGHHYRFGINGTKQQLQVKKFSSL
jgi:hypothetical protein